MTAAGERTKTGSNFVENVGARTGKNGQRMMCLLLGDKVRS